MILQHILKIKIKILNYIDIYDMQYVLKIFLLISQKRAECIKNKIKL